MIIDDHPVVLQGFTYMFQSIPEIELAASFTEAMPAIGYVEKTAVDVALLDINLPDVYGIEACQLLRKARPSMKVLAISNVNEYSIIKRMLESGASGYILKNCSAEEVISCIHQVLRGEPGLSESVREVMANHAKADIPIVTHREQQVLALLAQGLNSVEIGEKIFISPATVETHRRHLLRKFNAANVAALVHRANEMKFI